MGSSVEVQRGAPQDIELLQAVSERAESTNRALIVVPVAGGHPAPGDLLIGVEAADGLPASVVVIRRDSYAAWSTIHRGTSLDSAYAVAVREAPRSPRLPLEQLTSRLALEVAES